MQMERMLLCVVPLVILGKVENGSIVAKSHCVRRVV